MHLRRQQRRERARERLDRQLASRCKPAKGRSRAVSLTADDVARIEAELAVLAHG